MEISPYPELNQPNGSETPTKRNKINVGVRIDFVVFIVIGIILLLLQFVQFNLSIGPINITDVVLTNGLDEKGNPLPARTHFSPEEPRIVCAFTIISPNPVSVGARWFYEDELLYNDRGTLSGRGVTAIQPRPGQLFREGDYRVEIYLVDEAMETVFFSVGNRSP